MESKEERWFVTFVKEHGDTVVLAMVGDGGVVRFTPNGAPLQKGELNLADYTNALPYSMRRDTEIDDQVWDDLTAHPGAEVGDVVGTTGKISEAVGPFKKADINHIVARAICTALAHADGEPEGESAVRYYTVRGRAELAIQSVDKVVSVGPKMYKTTYTYLFKSDVPQDVMDELEEFFQTSFAGDSAVITPKVVVKIRGRRELTVTTSATIQF